MDEVWKPVTGYEGHYEISSKGRVRSVPRTRKRSDGQNHTAKGGVLKQSQDKKGYLNVSLLLGGKKSRKTHKVHRLVASAFIPNEYGFPQVNHKDNDKGNNVAENLEWVTQTQNMAHSLNSGTRNTRPVKCLNDGKVHKSLRRAAEHYGIDRTCISDVCNGARSATQGLMFEYASRERAKTEGLAVPWESDEQIALMEWAAWMSKKHPELNYLLCIPNGEFRHKKTAATLKRMGVKAGFPDMILPVSRHGYNSLAIELKRRKEAKSQTSPEQKAWIEYLNKQGWYAVVCYGAEDAIQKLEWYLKD